MFRNSNRIPQTQLFHGVSQTQTMDSHKDTENVMIRKILRDSWNKYNMQTSINNHGRVIDPFRAANNLGDYLSRPNYVCNTTGHESIPRRRPGWHVRNAQNTCDTTGITGASCNPRYVSDCSDYIRFKKQSAFLNKYNSIST